MQTIELLDRTITIETVPAVVPTMNTIWNNNAPDYLALITTNEKVLILPGEISVLQSLFLWMQKHPGTRALYLYRCSRLYGEYRASEQGLISYHPEKETIMILDLQQKDLPTYYELFWRGQIRPGKWRSVEGLSCICYFTWVYSS